MADKWRIVDYCLLIDSQAHYNLDPASMAIRTRRMNSNQSRITREQQYHDDVYRHVAFDDRYIRDMRSFRSPVGWIETSSPKLGSDVLEFFGDLTGSKVLVYGCGDKPAPLWFARNGATVDAFDLSAGAVEIQRALAKKLDLKISAFLADAHRTKLADKSYDLIYGNAILHHLDSPTVAKELSRLVRWKGNVIFREVLSGSVFLRLFRKVSPFCQTEDQHSLGQADFDAFDAEFGDVKVFAYTLAAQPYLLLQRLVNTVLRKLGFSWRWRRMVWFCALCDRLDELVFRTFPFTRQFAWLCLIVMTPSRSSGPSEHARTETSPQRCGRELYRQSRKDNTKSD